MPGGRSNYKHICDLPVSQIIFHHAKHMTNTFAASGDDLINLKNSGQSIDLKMCQDLIADPGVPITGTCKESTLNFQHTNFSHLTDDEMKQTLISFFGPSSEPLNSFVETVLRSKISFDLHRGTYDSDVSFGRMMFILTLVIDVEKLRKLECGCELSSAIIQSVSLSEAKKSISLNWFGYMFFNNECVAVKMETGSTYDFITNAFNKMNADVEEIKNFANKARFSFKVHYQKSIVSGLEGINANMNSLSKIATSLDFNQDIKDLLMAECFVPLFYSVNPRCLNACVKHMFTRNFKNLEFRDDLGSKIVEIFNSGEDSFDIRKMNNFREFTKLPEEAQLNHIANAAKYCCIYASEFGLPGLQKEWLQKLFVDGNYGDNKPREWTNFKNYTYMPFLVALIMVAKFSLAELSAHSESDLQNMLKFFSGVPPMSTYTSQFEEKISGKKRQKLINGEVHPTDRDAEEIDFSFENDNNEDSFLQKMHQEREKGSAIDSRKDYGVNSCGGPYQQIDNSVNMRLSREDIGKALHIATCFNVSCFITDFLTFGFNQEMKRLEQRFECVHKPPAAQVCSKMICAYSLAHAVNYVVPQTHFTQMGTSSTVVYSDLDKVVLNTVYIAQDLSSKILQYVIGVIVRKSPHKDCTNKFDELTAELSKSDLELIWNLDQVIDLFRFSLFALPFLKSNSNNSSIHVDELAYFLSLKNFQKKQPKLIEIQNARLTKTRTLDLYYIGAIANVSAELYKSLLSKTPVFHSLVENSNYDAIIKSSRNAALVVMNNFFKQIRDYTDYAAVVNTDVLLQEDLYGAQTSYTVTKLANSTDKSTQTAYVDALFAMYSSCVKGLLYAYIFGKSNVGKKAAEEIIKEYVLSKDRNSFDKKEGYNFFIATVRARKGASREVIDEAFLAISNLESALMKCTEDLVSRKITVKVGSLDPHEPFFNISNNKLYGGVVKDITKPLFTIAPTEDYYTTKNKDDTYIHPQHIITLIEVFAPVINHYTSTKKTGNLFFPFTIVIP